MRLAGYIRVSSTEQVEHGQGLDIQQQAIRKWAKTQGHKLTKIYADEGISGTADIEEREGLADALASIRYNGSEGLVITSIDRLARNLTVQEVALAEVWDSNGRVFTVDSGEVLSDDPDDPTRTAVRQILGAVAQMEAAMIARRLRKGKEHKRAAGGFAGGQVPYGFRSEGGNLVPDPKEREVIDSMIELRAKGNSYQAIAEHLNAAGIPSKRGGKWYAQTVSYAMTTATAGRWVAFLND